MSNHPDLDWRDHITQLDRLQRAVRVLAEGSGTLRERMDKATSALATAGSAFYRRQRHGKTSRSEAVSWVPCPPQRPRSAMARRWIGGGML